jgi:hypothetical protein
MKSTAYLIIPSAISPEFDVRYNFGTLPVQEHEFTDANHRQNPQWNLEGRRT